MAIPSDILSRLGSGRAVAAKIPAVLPDHQAWVWVLPTLDKQKGYFGRINSRSEIQIIRISDDDPINGYKLFHLEVPEKYLGKNLDIGYSDASVNEEYILSNEGELEKTLLHWLSDLSQLRPPGNVDYPF